MGQLLHRCATTTEAIRRAIQNSQASPEGASCRPRHSINLKRLLNGADVVRCTTLGWDPESLGRVLSKEEEALIVAFRKHTLLPLDDCLYALQATIPHLTRSSLHPACNGMA